MTRGYWLGMHDWLSDVDKHRVNVEKLTEGLHCAVQKGRSRGWVICGLFLTVTRALGWFGGDGLFLERGSQM